MDRLDCPLKGKIHPHDQAKKSLGQAGQNIPLKNGRKKFPDKQGKSLLKQKNLSLHRKTSP